MSANEWTPSASIDEEPVNANATNLPTAMAKLASSAAITAFWLWLRSPGSASVPCDITSSGSDR